MDISVKCPGVLQCPLWQHLNRSQEYGYIDLIFRGSTGCLKNCWFTCHNTASIRERSMKLQFLGLIESSIRHLDNSKKIYHFLFLHYGTIWSILSSNSLLYYNDALFPFLYCMSPRYRIWSIHVVSCPTQQNFAKLECPSNIHDIRWRIYSIPVLLHIYYLLQFSILSYFKIAEYKMTWLRGCYYASPHFSNVLAWAFLWSTCGMS